MPWTASTRTHFAFVAHAHTRTHHFITISDNTRSASLLLHTLDLRWLQSGCGAGADGGAGGQLRLRKKVRALKADGSMEVSAYRGHAGMFACFF